MGKAIANYTKDIKLRKNKLYLTIESAPLKQELSFGKEKNNQTAQRRTRRGLH